MSIVPEPVLFEWDKGNKEKNALKHNVVIQEIEQIFKNENNFIFTDEKHSIDEKRYALFGVTDKGRKLSVVFTIRNNLIRVITARDMSKSERRYYEGLKKNTKI